jgi:hypothetical protein
VVANAHGHDLDPLGHDFFHRYIEVQDVARVVPVREQNAAAGVNLPLGANNRHRRRRGEDVARHARVRQPAAQVPQRFMTAASSRQHRDPAGNREIFPRYGLNAVQLLQDVRIG